jgi:hypothetical protein
MNRGQQQVPYQLATRVKKQAFALQSAANYASGASPPTRLTLRSVNQQPDF